MPSEGAIRYSLAALKNVGRHAVEHIAQEREAGGAFRDVSDFARRINPRLVNKRALETLAAAGALDELGLDRATAFANVDRLIAAGNRSLETSAEGQDDLFAGAQHVPPPIELRAAKPWVPTDRLSHEFEAVGFFLTGHPLDDYKDVLEALESGQAYATLSLSAPSGGDDDSDLDPLESLGTLEHEYEVSEDRAVLAPGLAALDERERRILKLRFFEGLTQSQIAQQVGISQMHVSRLIRKSLSIMREELLRTPPGAA